MRGSAAIRRVVIAMVTIALCALCALVALHKWGVAGGQLAKSLLPGIWIDRYTRYTFGGSFEGGGPSLSPDNRFLVYSSPRTNRGDIYRANRDGTHIIALTTTSDCDIEPQYSPDGQFIAFTRETDKTSHLWLMRSDGTNQRQLTFGPLIDSGPLFLPDGQHVMFTRDTNDARQYICCTVDIIDKCVAIRQSEPFGTRGTTIHRGWIACQDSEGMVIVSVDGKNRRVIGNGSDPIIAPDGQTMAYLGGTYNDTIYRMAFDGSHAAKVYSSTTLKERPIFTRDGRTIVFSEFDKAGAAISQVGVDGSGYKRLLWR